MMLYDVIMLLIVIASAVQGAWRGLAWQVAPVASLVLGYMIAVPLSVSLAPYFGDPPSNHLFALLTVYVMVALAVYLMVRSVKESLEKLKLSEFDRHLGFILGGVKGVVITLIITITLVTVSAEARERILRSESSTIARTIMRQVDPILPEGLQKVITPYLQNLDELPADQLATNRKSATTRKPRSSPARPDRADTTRNSKNRPRSGYRASDGADLWEQDAPAADEESESSIGGTVRGAVEGIWSRFQGNQPNKTPNNRPATEPDAWDPEEPAWDEPPLGDPRSQPSARSSRSSGRRVPADPLYEDEDSTPAPRRRPPSRDLPADELEGNAQFEEEDPYLLKEAERRTKTFIKKNVVEPAWDEFERELTGRERPRR